MCGRSIQIVCRSKSAAAAKQKAESIFASMSSSDELFHLTLARWCLLNIRQHPFKMKVDNRGRTYYCFNIEVNTNLS
jgi:hypothetical protein